MHTVIVSTHYDDAVLSGWTLMDGVADVDVVTVFTQPPPPGFLTRWDQGSGAPDSATRVEQRAAENRAALALAGARPIDVGLLEGQYGGGPVRPDELEPFIADAEVVYVPAAVFVRGTNTEHALVRDAALAVRPDARLYVDQPYCQFRSDVPLPPRLSRGRSLQAVSLDETTRTRKAEAIGCYTGELHNLEAFFGPLTEPDVLRQEGFWVER
jgi:hypothetical protein